MIDFGDRIRAFTEYLRQMPLPLDDDEREVLRELYAQLQELLKQQEHKP